MKSFLRPCALTALVAPLLLLPGQGLAATEVDRMRITASDNSCVDKRRPDTDPSECDVLWVTSNGAATVSKLTYLSFDVSPLPAGTITFASLELYSLLVKGDGRVWVLALNDSAERDRRVRVLLLKDIRDPGSETKEITFDTGVTWYTRPSGTQDVPNRNTSGPLASILVPKANPKRLVSFDLTSALPGLLASDTNHELTFILFTTTDGINMFASLDNASGYPVPTLTVEYIPIRTERWSGFGPSFKQLLEASKDEGMTKDE